LQDIITCLTGIMILIVLILALEAMLVPEEGAAGVHIEIPDVVFMQKRLEDLEKQKQDLLAELVRREPLDPELSPADRVRKVIEMRQRLTFLEGEVREQSLARQRLSQQQIPVLNELHQLREDSKALRDEDEKWEKVATSASNWVTFLPGKGVEKTAHLLVVDALEVKLISLGEPERNREWAVSSNSDSLAGLMRQADNTKEYFVILLKPSAAEIGLAMYHILRGAGFNAGYDTLEEDALVVAPEVIR
jgi:hypothetical protein